MLYFKRLIQIPRLPEVPALLSTLGSESLDNPGCLAGPHVGSGDGQGRLLGGVGGHPEQLSPMALVGTPQLPAGLGAG